MMKRFFTFACATAVSLAAFSSCSNDPTVSTGGSGTTGANLLFKQIDRIGRPGLKQLYIAYANHDAFNRLSPNTDAVQVAPQIATFMTAAGRSAAISQYVQELLVPDVLVFNAASTATTASYLGWETGGQIPASCNGGAPNAFGGRALNDDVVTVMLGLAYGNLATSATITNPATTNVFSFSTNTTTTSTPPPDDGKEQNGQNGTPLLSKQNIACTSKSTPTSSFPYLQAPI
jgi:hypothetical protein